MAIGKAYRGASLLPNAQVTLLKVNGAGAWDEEELAPVETSAPPRKAGTKNARR